MRLGRDELRYMALMALEDVASQCDEGPVRRSIWLRFLLAWLYHESGGDPATKWIFTSFWTAATSPLDESRELIDRSCRTTSLQASLNAITRVLGWERTVSFMHEMEGRRRSLGDSAAPLYRESEADLNEGPNA